MTELLIPLLLFSVSLYALSGKTDVYASFVEGAGAGLRTLLSIAPALIILLTAVSMLRASGFTELMSGFLQPVCRFVGIPAEVLPLMLIRPVSGSAALAVGADLMRQYGVDSRIGRTAAVMLGSSETTFYTVGVYFGACGVRKTRHTIPAAVIADLTGFFMAALSVRWFFPE